jgi:hypothetical protein
MDFLQLATKSYSSRKYEARKVKDKKISKILILSSVLKYKEFSNKI